jgi:hypothetical protein
MIREEEHYKRVCVALDLYVKRMDDSFRLFVQLSIATAGGFIWLKIQPNANAAECFFPLVRWVLPLLAASTMFQIGSDLFGWFGYRRQEAILLNRPYLDPRLPRSGHLELFRIVAAAFVGWLGFVYLR